MLVDVDNNIELVMMMASLGVVVIVDGGVGNDKHGGQNGPCMHGPSGYECGDCSGGSNEKKNLQRY